jgi:hypothetical protein
VSDIGGLKMWILFGVGLVVSIALSIVGTSALVLFLVYQNKR